MTAGVEPAATSIAKAWRANGGDDTWLRLKTQSGDLSQFDDAVTAANELAQGRHEDNQVWGLFATTTSDGFAIQLVRAVSLDMVHRWVADLSEQLSIRGFTGKLGGAPFRDAPPCLFPTLPPVPTGYVNWCLGPGLRAPAGRQPYAGWRVDPAATNRITTLLDDWARRPAAQLVLRRGSYSVAVELSSAAPQLAQAVTESGMAGLDFIVDSRTAATHTARRQRRGRVSGCR